MKEASIETVYPGRKKDEIKLGHAPPNKFMPKPENLKSLKCAKPSDGKPGIPKRIDSPNFTLWFK